MAAIIQTLCNKILADVNLDMNVNFFLQQYAKVLAQQAVAYVNVDTAVTGNKKFSFFEFNDTMSE